MRRVHLVTGAFGYSGSYIARELLAAGHEVRTLTSKSGAGHDLEGQVAAYPLDFDDMDGLRLALTGVHVLHNTYWVRFSKAGFSQALAVRNTKRLFECAQDTGVERIVHVSITHPSIDSPYEYFRGKAELEASLATTGIPHTILRPAVLFGGDDILINNIAWSLRHLPVFGVFGDGAYRLQPIHVQDFARLAVLAGRGSGDEVIDAVGPEIWGYRDLVQALAKALRVRRLIVSMPTSLALLGSRLVGLAQRDVVLTREEVGALMDDLLVTDSVLDSEMAPTRLSTWMSDHASELGRDYASELSRRTPVTD